MWGEVIIYRPGEQHPVVAMRQTGRPVVDPAAEGLQRGPGLCVRPPIGLEDLDVVLCPVGVVRRLQPKQDPNNLPSTEEAAKPQPKQDKSFFPPHFSSFLTVYLLFKCRFVD